MAVLSITNAHLAFGHVALLDGASFSLEVGERVGLIGRNGTGKSSLLKILAGIEKLDDGLLQLQQAVIEFFDAGEDFQQRGLARAIAADEAYTLANFQRERSAIEQGHVAESKMRIGD